MSKFIDKLSLVSQGGLKPMGFRATAEVAKPRMLLVAAVAQVEAGRLADSVAGADAGLLLISKSSSGAKTLKKLCQAASDIPWGGWLKEASGEGIEPVVAAGGDFVVFPAGSASLAILDEKKLGKILEVKPSLEPELLKAIDDLPVDAVLIAAEDGKDYLLTWQHLMLFRRCANLLPKPLLVSVPSKLAVSELQAIWETGVGGVVVEIEAKGKLAKLRQRIDKLVLPSPDKRRKAEPLVSLIRGETVVASEEEEE